MDAVTFNKTYSGDRANTQDHPCVFGNMKVKPNNGVYHVGLIVTRDANRDLVPAAPDAAFVGVIDEPVDTAVATSAIVVRHGTVRRECLKTAGNVTAEAADEDKLAAVGIYPV
ncbi:MAG: hypothetical protein ACNI27_07120 [Desulfovibrio sp.]